MNSAPAFVHQSVHQALSSRHFFIADGLRARIVQESERAIRWELFRGHLLDPRHTREEAQLSAWHWYLLGKSDDPRATCLSSHRSTSATEHPLLSLFYHAADQQLHVVRYLLTHDWNQGASGESSTASAATPQHYWARELVASIAVPTHVPLAEISANSSATSYPAEFPDAAWRAFHRALVGAIQSAFQGTNRLPITSLETPLPAFTFGCCAYLPGVSDRIAISPSTPAAPGLTSSSESPTETVIAQALTLAGLRTALGSAAQDELHRTPSDRAAAVGIDAEWPRALETLLRAGSEHDLRELVTASTVSRWLTWTRQLFHHVSLTPVTAWIDRAFILLDAIMAAAPDPAPVCDLVGHMLRHLVRHLTAYDLEKFHSFGANYPDAPWLDRLLRWLIAQIEQHPELFLTERHSDEQEDEHNGEQAIDSDTALQQRLRRRALRQAWLLRKHYEGLLVPETPTSQGEIRRVLPAEVPVVPEEQITQPRRRHHRLFDHQPLTLETLPQTRRVLQAALDDLQFPTEYQELGMATFLDRPLGLCHAPGEVDQTPLFSYQAFSARIAQQRLAQCRPWGATVDAQHHAQWPGPRGISVTELPGRPRPGVTTLEDAQFAAPDFRIISMSSSSLRDFLQLVHDHEEPREQAPRERAPILLPSLLEACGPLMLLRTATAEQAAHGQPALALIDRNQRAIVRWKLAAPYQAGQFEWQDRVEWPRGGLTRLPEPAVGIVLCGGQSRRMGEPKAWLPIGEETFLQRLVRVVGSVVEQVIVVAAADQQLPQLSSDLQVVCDERPDQGPLEGLLAGLAAAAGRADRAFVIGCDTPLVPPSIIRHFLQLLAVQQTHSATNAVVGFDGAHDQPLLAAYDTGIIDLVRQCLARDERSLRALLREPTVRVRRVGKDELTLADPELLSLRNVNTPDDYREALRAIDAR